MAEWLKGINKTHNLSAATTWKAVVDRTVCSYRKGHLPDKCDVNNIRY